MSGKYKRKGKAKFLMIEGYVKRSDAWKALTPVERVAYLEIKWRYDGLNNGRIGLGCRELADDINMSRNSAARAFDGLQQKGFIVKAKASAFNIKNRMATEWRLTELKCDVTGELATKDFTRWTDQKKQQSHPRDTQSHPRDADRSIDDENTTDSPIHGTVKPVSTISQSHPRDTYRYTTGNETKRSPDPKGGQAIGGPSLEEITKLLRSTAENLDSEIRGSGNGAA